MRLARLRVRGLRSFTRETEIDLGRLGEQGLFAISGPTGSGKSTVLDGIFLALFGRCPRGEASECVSAGALELTVRLELEEGRGVAARVIAVERRYRWSKKRSSAEGAVGAELRGAPRHAPLRIEERRGEAWEPVDLGGRKAEEYLAEQIVRVSMDDFQQAVVLPQGEFDALLQAKPAERRQLVASLFRTEHLGQPLLDVLKSREMTVRGEMGRLEEAEREVSVSEADAEAATGEAAGAATEAQAAVRALADAEARATELRSARRRCEARDLAAAALDRAAREVAAREGDRSRLLRGRQAAGAQGAVEELSAAEADAGASEAHAARAEAEARAAEVQRKEAEVGLAQAIEARTAELPRAQEQLGVARQAVMRARDLAALDEDREAKARALRAAEGARREAGSAHAAALSSLAAAERDERAAAEQLDAARVGEDERSAAVAAAAVAELCAAEVRLAAVLAEERAAAEARVTSLEEALAAAEGEARARDAAAERAHAEQRRRTIDAQRAAAEVEVSERSLTDARRAAAAADLAASLVPGAPCPVCGAREHPGKDLGPAVSSISLAERALTATRRLAQAADRDRDAGARDAAARDEEARTAGARVETVAADLAAAREAALQQASGAAIPRAVAEARAAVDRLAARADVDLSALPPDRRDTIREAARREPAGAAVARIEALARRARQAEDLERARARAQVAAERARAEAQARLDAIDRAERARAAAEAAAAAAASLGKARRDEIAALLEGLAPRGPRGEPPPRPKSAADWVADLETRTSALRRREEDARASLEEVRTHQGRLDLEAREATVRRRDSATRLTRAQHAAETAIARAGFESLASLREALLDPAALDALEDALRHLDEARERAAAVLAERRRDVTAEVTEAEARAAEIARDETRSAEGAARERAARARARADELARRRARGLELRAKIDTLAPRARRLGQIRQIVSGSQLSELAAERHLEAVTRGAAALLRTLSSDRYALTRTPDGAFAVADAAHGGLVRTPSTLSGGETFLVSLALALSLSERIQLAGRTRFDFFFLDEGFGSLDAGTLDVALGALETLRGPSRVIGMISHVPAIEERMPRRLRVSTERRGGATVVAHEP